MLNRGVNRGVLNTIYESVIKMSKNIIIDYLTFTSKIDTIDTLKEFLGFSDLPFQELKGRYFYKKRLSFDGINIYYDGFDDDMGICIEMSGKGCRNFENLGSGDYNELLSYIVSNPDDLNLTRLDLAFDDFDNLLNFDTIIDNIQAKNYLSRFRKFKVINEYSQVDNNSTTIYCGSDKSDTLFRIYDKKAEQKRVDLDHWIRFEIQLRDNRASCFANLLMSGNSLGSLFVKVINNYLRFIVPNCADTNRSRWNVADWWFKFLGTLEKISLFIPDVDYTETRLEKFVKNQCSGAVVAFIALFGFSYFRDIVQGKSQLHINPKYENLLKEHGIDNISELFNSDLWNEKC